MFQKIGQKKKKKKTKKNVRIAKLMLRIIFLSSPDVLNVWLYQFLISAYLFTFHYMYVSGTVYDI